MLVRLNTVWAHYSTAQRCQFVEQVRTVKAQQTALKPHFLHAKTSKSNVCTHPRITKCKWSVSGIPILTPWQTSQQRSQIPTFSNATSLLHKGPYTRRAHKSEANKIDFACFMCVTIDAYSAWNHTNVYVIQLQPSYHTTHSQIFKLLSELSVN